ncbi:MAG TPA: hypothetical protein PK725_12550 [Rhodocyclaceae bacterium]|nr:hypothetical protein [Rhodocyclaceae bacterium]
MEFSIDIPLMFADHGIDATYTTGTDDPVPCRVMEDRNVEVIGDYGQAIDRRTALSFIAAQVPAPVRGAVVAELAPGTRVWKIDRVIEDDGDVVQALVLR